MKSASRSKRNWKSCSRRTRASFGSTAAAALRRAAPLAAAPAFAIDLQQAKAQGLVGETPSGYLALVKENVPDEVKALAQKINAERRSRYQEIAERNGTTLQAVEALTGRKAIEKSAPGHYVRLPSGQWVKKKKE